MVETAEHVWTVKLSQPLTYINDGVIVVSVKDKRGNESVVTRSFNITAAFEGDGGLPPPK
jgi:hypothetical protein